MPLSGPTECLNPFGLASSYLSCTTDLGASNKLRCWWTWAAPCVQCSLPVKPMQGIFCGNFCSSQNGFLPCRSAWHVECYACLGQGLFPITEIQDEAGNAWHKGEARKKRLNKGMKCAHTCIPFHCKLCWMRNLEGRELMERDDMYIKCIRRANLDAFSGKSHLLIGSHRREIVANIKQCRHLSVHPLV
jgi:hypothetical protein